MLDELNLNGQIVTNEEHRLNFDKVKITKLFEEINKSLEDILSHAIDTFQNQIKLLVDTKLQQDEVSMSPFINLSSERFILLLSKIMRINKQKLNDQFRERLEYIKNLLKCNNFCLSENENENNEINNKENSTIDLDRMINFDLYYMKSIELLKKFDLFFKITYEKLKDNFKSSNLFKKNVTNKQQTDFYSDTELLSYKNISKNKLNKINSNLKKRYKIKKADIYLCDEEDSSSKNIITTSDSESENEVESKFKNYSDTELDNMSICFDESVINEQDTETSNSGQESNDENTEYEADSESFDYSFDYSFDSNSEEMDQDLLELRKLDCNNFSDDSRNNLDKRLEQRVNNENQDEDCIIICEEDFEMKKATRKTNKCLEIINKLISSNKELKIIAPIRLGMKVLALKDKEKHKWKLARIVRISDQNLLKNNTETTNATKNGKSKSDILKSHEMVCNSKYYVVFDSDTEDESDMNESNFNDINDDLYQDQRLLNDQNENSDQGSIDSIEVDSSENEINSEEKDFSLANNKKRKLKPKINIQGQTSTKSYEPFVKKRTNPIDHNSVPVELDSKSVAFLDNYDEIFPVGFNTITNSLNFPPKSRVVTLYQLKIKSNDKNRVLINHEYMSSGTVIEVPSSTNYHRYLILFDNGFCSYVKPTHLFPIFDLFTFPADSLNLEHLEFLNNYFRFYPERKVVRLNINDEIKVYLYKKWHTCRVVDIDCSLVTIETKNNIFYQLKNKNLNLKKHVYNLKLFRGSFSIQPLYEQLINKMNNFSLRSTTESSQYEEYIKNRRENNIQSANYNKYLSIFASSIFPLHPPSNRNIKLKSNSNNLLPISKNQKLSNEKVIQGQIKHLDMDSLMRDEIISFKPHPCTNACVAKWECHFNRVKWVNPLLMPVLHGWQRHICHQSKTISSASKKWINYVAPCGRMLRSTSEVDRYLYLTNSKLTIDMFTFDYFIHTDREYEANARYLKIEDISNKQENVPISAVNCVDSSRPEYFEYSAKRIPLEGVPLNTDETLMEGCNCTDNCRDRSKCACWRKTFEATLFTSSDQMNTNVGYRGRRLHELVNTGIFECNSKCKCDCRCSNRVVQNGISVRLQLFKTNNKGWGLRCLDDIPKGTFICTYAGHLLTEEQSDIRGKDLGDEYFAELDFVECLNQMRKTVFIENQIKFQLNEDSQSDINSFSSDSNDLSGSKNKIKQTSKKVLSRKDQLQNYQRPKQKQHMIKNQNSGLNENECIVLDSDEDEQDRNDIVNFEMLINRTLSQREDEYNRNRAMNRKQKEKRVANYIDSNRFFTSENNEFYFINFLERSGVFIMDAKICGNIGRYFNHSCSPNIFVQNVFVDTYDLRFPWISFFALSSIKAGTELCWDYNYTIGSVKDRVLLCHCNSSNCRGRLL